MKIISLIFVERNYQARMPAKVSLQGVLLYGNLTINKRYKRD